ncbi:hypothetical protein J7F01_18395 [Streptomyces sp. ISL-22]|uniref:hypothetical protein n=1 Tax=unclassified Streptomyces TaxID=2593676 RepID=UPI001BE697D1|nr:MULTISPECIES: hypothetical protein [unclassified Streptomyces]MBT2423127.1 hypothetical protein [Streptomyces sp. ISL-24]MBT2434112.1 hypothetical protein [Streptomyces sp. ISL-22]
MDNTVNSRTPAASSAPDSAHPVDVRLMGDDHAVRALVAALQQAAACGPATYKPMRDGSGTRAYLSVIVPAGPAPAT